MTAALRFALCVGCGAETDWDDDLGSKPLCSDCWDHGVDVDAITIAVEIELTARERAGRERWASMSDEEKARLSEASRERWASMSDEEKDAVVARLSEARRERWASMSDEEKARLSEASRERWASMSDEEKARLSEASRERWASMSDEEKARLSEASRERWASMSDEERRARSKKRAWTLQEDRWLRYWVDVDGWTWAECADALENVTPQKVQYRYQQLKKGTARRPKS